MRDDLDAGRKRDQTVHVIAVAVRDDGGRDRLRRDLGDFGEQILRAGLSLLGIDDDDARLADDDGAVAACAAQADPHVGFQLFHREHRRWLLSHGGSERAESENDGESQASLQV